MVRGNKGFALIGLIIVLPLLIGSVAMVSWLVWFGYHKQKIETLCYRHVLQAQKHLLVASQEVLDLNPKAARLQKQSKRWLRILRTSPLPVVRALAVLKLAQISASQVLLRLRQRKILSRGGRLAEQELFELRRNLYPILKKMSGAWGETPQTPKIYAQPQPPQLKVKKWGIASTYKRGINYGGRQELSAEWEVRLPNSLNSLFVLRHSNNNWRGRCYSHPRRKAGQWVSHLGRARPSSKLSPIFSSF